MQGVGELKFIGTLRNPCTNGTQMKPLITLPILLLLIRTLLNSLSMKRAKVSGVIVCLISLGDHAFPSEEDEDAAVIYNYQPVYTADIEPDYEQCYFFG